MFHIHDHATVNTEQLIPILFFHASEAERTRILSLIDCAYALWSVFRYHITPPVQAVVGGRESKNIIAKPNVEEAFVLSAHPPPVSPHPLNGYEGFTMEQYVSLKLYIYFPFSIIYPHPHHHSLYYLVFPS